MKSILLFISFLLAGQWTNAQSQAADITLAANDYIDAFYLGDTIKLKRSISPTVFKYGYFKKKDSPTYVGEPMSYKDMIEYATRVNKRGPSPKLSTFPRQVEILSELDQIASVKLTAWWGVDFLLLAKIDGKWMITQVLWQSPPAGK